MPTPMSLSSLLASAAILFLTASASAQLHSGMPAPLPGLPAVPPPVDHPALGAQPLMNETGSGEETTTTKKKSKTKAKAEKPDDPAIKGPKVVGRDLKKAVKEVAALKWHDSLKEARTLAGAAGKPVLWLYALGDIDREA
ncbi:MAG TPA: hypothetical protein VF384_00780 [Planctomycetota bacterium]